MRRFSFLIVGSLIAVGCQTDVPPYRPQNHPSIAELEKTTMPGSSEISGQAILRQRGGGIVTCAGNNAVLIPRTNHNIEIFNAVLRHENVYPGDFDFIVNQYTRKNNCDALGKFKFTKVPEGSYILLTKVEWVVGYNVQGGFLYKIINVGKKDSIDVSLGDSNRM